MQRTTTLHFSSVALTGAFVLLALGSGKPKGGATADGSAVATTPASAASAPKGAPPKDLDVAALEKELGCAGQKSDLCRVWADFGSATEAPDLPKSGMAIYVGKSFAFGGPKEGHRNYVFVQIIGESTAAPPGMSDSDVLGANVVLRTYEPARDDTSDAEALITTLKAGKKRPAFSSFALNAEMKVFTRTPDAVVRTSGPSVGFAELGGVIGWMRKKDDRLLIVEHMAAGPTDHEARGGGLAGGPTKTVAAKVWCTEAWLLEEK